MTRRQRPAGQVKEAAYRAGFDAVGICALRPIERGALGRWLAAGYAASMRYMYRQAALRERPEDIVCGCRRAVVVLKNYWRLPTPRPGRIARGSSTTEYPERPNTPLRPALARGERKGGSSNTAESLLANENLRQGAGRVARYAWGEDYHRVVGDQLARLAAGLVELGSTPALTRWYVDAGPVPERELAQRAGLGWIGKNTMLIHPRLGSFTFIGTVFTDLDLAVDAPFTADRCGTCRRCLEACPTAAFPEPRCLDARRCISYLTIEHRGPFDEAQGAMIGEWLFGCDTCQDVCPWNLRFAHHTNEPCFVWRSEIQDPDLHELAQMDSPDFERHFRATAFERPGRKGMARNAQQVLRNMATKVGARGQT
jgi:epoxyqueuosine reductase